MRALPAVLVLSACRPTAPGSELRADTDEARSPSERFRDVFAAYLGAAEGDALTDTIFLPTPEMLALASETSLDAIGQRFAAISPVALNERSKAVATVPYTPQAPTDMPTVVLIPGIFSEFIDTYPFEALFRNAQGGSFGDATDRQYRLRDMEESDVALNDIVAMGTVDGVRYIALKAPYLSLESLGTIDSSAEIYMRRLDRVFQVIGRPSRVMLVGYSRGGPVVLEMAARAADVSWGESLATVVTLCGVNFGSDAADDIRKEGSSQQRLFAALGTLKEELRDLDEVSSLQVPGVVSANTAAWGRFAAVLAQNMRGGGSAPDVRGADITAAWGMVAKAWDEFGLRQLFSGYSANIKKFKVLSEAVMKGVEGLTSEERVGWWRTRELPARVRYLAIAATMADDTVEEERALATNTHSYDPGSLDVQMLQGGYRDFKRSSSFGLNDSQVAVHKAALWSGVIGALDSRKAGLKAEWLGVIGSHHWGVALEVVNRMSNGSTNPYPREALLKALAQYGLASETR